MNAADRDDDGQRAISVETERILGICFDERMRARRASQLPLIDPQMDLFEFQQVVGIVEKERKNKANNS